MGMEIASTLRRLRAGPDSVDSPNAAPKAPTAPTPSGRPRMRISDRLKAWAAANPAPVTQPYAGTPCKAAMPVAPANANFVFADSYGIFAETDAAPSRFAALPRNAMLQGDSLLA